MQSFVVDGTKVVACRVWARWFQAKFTKMSLVEWIKILIFQGSQAISGARLSILVGVGVRDRLDPGVRLLDRKVFGGQV
jgi:hypothetical protein